MEGGLADQLAVQSDHLHRPGVGDAVDLPPDGPEQKQHPGALHAASGGPRAGPAEHKQNQDHLGELGPHHKVCGAKAGGGDDGGHLEHRVAGALPQAGVHLQVGQGQHAGGPRNQDEKETQLVALHRVPPPAGEDQKVHREVDREQEHEHRQNHLHRHAAVGPGAGVPAGEAPRPRGGEGVNQRVVQGQTRQLETEGLQNGEGEVHGVENFGGLGLLGDQLGEYRPRGLRLGQVVGADAQLGDDGGGQHQHSHPAQPVGEGPPEEDALGQGLNVGENGGAGGGKARDRLKQAVGEGGEPAGEPEGEGPHYPGEDPDESHRGKTLPGKELLLGGQGGQPEPADGDKGDGQQEGDRVFPKEQRRRQRSGEGGGLDEEHPAHQLEDQLQVHVGVPPGGTYSGA